MILPFAINSTAVFIFRQYFLQLPKELFDAARIDGAGELRTCGRSRFRWSGRPCSPRAAHLHRAVERIPVAVPDHQGAEQAAARGVTGELHLHRSGQPANPFGAVLAGAVVLAAPASRCSSLFQKHFVSTDLGSGVKGCLERIPSSCTDVPYRLSRIGVVMSPAAANPVEAEGVLNPASGRDPDGGCTCCRDWSPQATSPGSAWPRSSCRRGSGRASAGSRRARSGRAAGSAARPTAASRIRSATWMPDLGAAPDDLRGLRPARAEARARRVHRPAELETAGALPLRVPGRAGHRPEPVSRTKTW